MLLFGFVTGITVIVYGMKMNVSVDTLFLMLMIFAAAFIVGGCVNGEK